MTFKEFEQLKPGTRLKFKDAWPKYAEWPNEEGQMDHWLGQIVTFRYHEYDEVFRIEEDVEEHYGGWFWNMEIIEYVVEEGEEFDAASEDEFNGLFEMGAVK